LKIEVDCFHNVAYLQITAPDIVNAEKIFGSLSLVTTSQLSQFRLMSLVGETRQKALSNAKDQKKSKQSKLQNFRFFTASMSRAGGREFES